MYAKLLIFIGGVFAAILTALLAVVRNNGKKAEQLRALKETAERQAKEQEKADEINRTVDGYTNDDTRARLRRVAEGHKRNGV